MPALYANTAGLTEVAGQLAAAAQSLAALAGTPLAHPPLAADEVSTSAAARLSEHGAVLASRAADGAQVLGSAAAAVQEIVRAFGDMDADNASAMSLHGAASGGVGAAMTPAVTADVTAPDVPILAAPGRDGEVLAAMMEAGRSEAGASFVRGCQAYRVAFRNCAVAVRAAQTAVDGSLQGHTAPRLSTALGRFAAWADAMTAHADTVGGAAAGHRQRFDTAKHDTPRTQEFVNKRRELENARALNARYGGAYSGVVTALQGQLASLHSQAGFAATNYHVGELPAAPPPPPPVVPVVNPTAPGQGENQPGPGVGQSDEPGSTRGRHAGTSDIADEALAAGGSDGGAGLGDALDSDPAVAGAPEGSGLAAEGGAPLAAMLPSMLAGTLGGVLGAAASIPAQIGQQAQSFASQAEQAVQGLTTGLTEPDLGDLDAPDTEPIGDFSPGVGGGAGGGGAETGPAGGQAPLQASGGGMLAMGAPGPSTPLVAGAAPPAAGTAPAAGAGGGMPMFMPPMAGMGGQGGGTRPVKDPDKTIHVPREANSEMVKGEVQRRNTAVADDPTGEKKRAAPAARVAVTSSRRRIELPKDDG
ncbi:PE domain-containing protein [Mycobacterium heckeshornense]|uniref:PE domain-containing protein n=1 Tax=Mycobacterium heckeshornense TaxID=110505 RepID=UPI00066242D9|nr:PE domain-containing protein [Mycobacterium heckeshornense]